MFFIIELFSNDLLKLFELVIHVLNQNDAVTVISKSSQKENLFLSTQYFRLNIHLDNDRKIFDKEEYGVEINTVLWIDVIPNSNYVPVIAYLLIHLLDQYSDDVIMFNTGYDTMIIRKEDELIIGNDNLPMVKEIKKWIVENESN